MNQNTQFAHILIWANCVLKKDLLKGHSINQRINQLVSRIKIRFANLNRQLEEPTNKMDFLVRTSLPYSLTAQYFMLRSLQRILSGLSENPFF